MKVIIASDLHGSYYYTEQLIKKFNSLQAEKLILLGDILYHGPRNDLPKDYAPKKVIALLNQMANKIVCVRGNCDAEVDQMVLDFKVLKPNRLITLNGKRVFLTHGHKFNIDNPPKNAISGDTVIYGHTHIPLDEVKNGIRFLNPGSVSIPKNSSDNSFILFDGENFNFLSLEK